MNTVLVMGARMVLTTILAVMGERTTRLVRIGHEQRSVAMVVVAVMVTLTAVPIMTMARDGRDYQRAARVQFRYDQDIMVVVWSWCNQDVIVVQAASRGDPVSKMAIPVPRGRRDEAITARGGAGVLAWRNMTALPTHTATMSRGDRTTAMSPGDRRAPSRSDGMASVVPPLRKCPAARRMPQTPGLILGLSCRRSQTNHCRQHQGQ